MRRINRKAEIDIKSILAGLMFVVLIASLVGLFVQSTITEYSGQMDNYSQTQSHLERITIDLGGNSTEYENLMQDYNSTLFEEREQGPEFFDFVDFMWKGAWNVLKQTVQLPGKVFSLFNSGMDFLQIPEAVQTPIKVFITSILMLIVIFAIIFKLRGAK